MHCAEHFFQEIVGHQGVSHHQHAKTSVPFTFKTMSFPYMGTKHSETFYGGIAFGCSVFLHYHTDKDFTMSIAQVYLKGHGNYERDDVVVVYFYFPTLGVAVPLHSCENIHSWISLSGD
jgi:hypothetical protein